MDQTSDNRLIGIRVLARISCERVVVPARRAGGDVICLCHREPMLRDFAGDQKRSASGHRKPAQHASVAHSELRGHALMSRPARAARGASRTRAPDFPAITPEHRHATSRKLLWRARGACCGPNRHMAARVRLPRACGSDLLSTEFARAADGALRSGLFGRKRRNLFDTSSRVSQAPLRGGHFGLRCRSSAAVHQFELQLGKPGEATRSATDRSASRTDGRVIRVIAC